MIKSRMQQFSSVLIVVIGIVVTAKSPATEIRDICRIKGQEESVINGWGLVVGLNGTGAAGDGPTIRALARSLQLMGGPAGTNGIPDPAELEELRKVKNVALVLVSATIPATGVRRGDKLNCQVAAFSGTSLEGGRLAFAALMGPNIQTQQVYGLAQGTVIVDDPSAPLVGRIHNGCQMVQDIRTPFQLDGRVTLVIDRHHADFVTATAIAQQIRQSPELVGSPEKVEAVDAATIVVHIPEAYYKDPVDFVAQILMIDLYSEKEPEARININTKTGRIVISGDVEIGEVVIKQNDVTVDTTGGGSTDFVALQPDSVESPKLKYLVETLNQLKVPTDDIIEIIKGIERTGKLHGRLIIE